VVKGCFDAPEPRHDVCDLNAKYADIVHTQEVLDYFETLPSGLFTLPKGE